MQHNRKNNDSAQISSTNTTVLRSTSTLIATVVIKSHAAGSTLDQLQLSTPLDVIVTTIVASYWKTTRHQVTKTSTERRTINGAGITRVIRAKSLIIGGSLCSVVTALIYFIYHRTAETKLSHGETLPTLTGNPRDRHLIETWRKIRITRPACTSQQWSYLL